MIKKPSKRLILGLFKGFLCYVTYYYYIRLNIHKLLRDDY